MGRESTATVRHGGRETTGKALLESAEIIVRGELRLRLPLAGITRVTVRGDDLVLLTAAGTTVLTLGAREAALWAEKIRNPRSLLDKLGVKPGLRVALVGLSEADLPEPLAARGVERVGPRSLRDLDLLLAAADGPAALEKLPRWRAALRPDGGLWVIYRKGVKSFGEDAVRAAARAQGLVDVKVAAFSATHSALKLVVPRGQR